MLILLLLTPIIGILIISIAIFVTLFYIICNHFKVEFSKPIQSFLKMPTLISIKVFLYRKLILA